MNQSLSDPNEGETAAVAGRAEQPQTRLQWRRDVVIVVVVVVVEATMQRYTCRPMTVHGRCCCCVIPYIRGPRGHLMMSRICDALLIYRNE